MTCKLKHSQFWRFYEMMYATQLCTVLKSIEFKKIENNNIHTFLFAHKMKKKIIEFRNEYFFCFILDLFWLFYANSRQIVIQNFFPSIIPRWCRKCNLRHFGNHKLKYNFFNVQLLYYHLMFRTVRESTFKCIINFVGDTFVSFTTSTAWNVKNSSVSTSNTYGLTNAFPMARFEENKFRFMLKTLQFNYNMVVHRIFHIFDDFFWGVSTYKPKKIHFSRFSGMKVTKIFWSTNSKKIATKRKLLASTFMGYIWNFDI